MHSRPGLFLLEYWLAPTKKMQGELEVGKVLKFWRPGDEAQIHVKVIRSVIRSEGVR